MANNRSRTSKASPTPQNRNQQTRPGDATGKERERLQNEHADAIREAATHTTLVSPPPPVVTRPDEVVDYTSGGDSHTGADQDVRLISMDDAVADGSTLVSQYDIPESQVDIDALEDGRVTAGAPPEVIQRTEEPRPAHERQPEPPQQQVPQQGVNPRAVQQVEAPKVERAHRVMRVNTDLEDITIGKDNHYSFFVGKAYKVPAHVYDHLWEKGYVLA